MHEAPFGIGAKIAANRLRTGHYMRVAIVVLVRVQEVQHRPKRRGDLSVVLKAGKLHRPIGTHNRQRTVRGAEIQADCPYGLGMLLGHGPLLHAMAHRSPRRSMVYLRSASISLTTELRTAVPCLLNAVTMRISGAQSIALGIPTATIDRFFLFEILQVIVYP